MVKDNNLPDRLKALGFPLFEVNTHSDANRTIADVVKSHDLRLWEGFPTMLANSASRGLFDHAAVVSKLAAVKDRAALQSLIALALALYTELGLKYSWYGALYNSLNSAGKKEYASFLDKLKKNADLTVSSHTISPERLKSTFNTYLDRSHSNLNELLAEKDELGIEYALSQVFTAKQKELFLNKLRGEKLAKTDAEYYSRVIKKKVLALANGELHRLARKLLE